MVVRAIGLLLAATPLAASAAEPVLAAYSLLAPAPDGRTVTLARVVVAAGEACPVLTVDGRTVASAPRANPDPTHFPVTVCEAIQPFGSEVAVAGGLVLPKVSGRAERVAILGDTGCGAWQDCADPDAWPFARIAARAAEADPDVVVHVGDYVYRGTPTYVEIEGVRRATYNAGNYAPDDTACQLTDPYYTQNGPGSALPDSWAAWREDFFVPAAPLLAQAPWVVARGNHELCSRAGPGWFYFLDPGSDLLGGARSCPVQSQGGDALPNLAFTPPYAVELADLRLVVMDTANACDQHANFADRYAAQLDEVARLAAGGPTWLVTHRPIWGVDWLNAGTEQTSNVTLRQALTRTDARGLADEVGLVLSGHIHRFEAFTFAEEEAPQLVIGNSGISLERDELQGSFTVQFDGRPARGIAVDAFGFLDARVGSDGVWGGDLLDPAGTVLARCASPGAGGEVCTRP